MHKNQATDALSRRVTTGEDWMELKEVVPILIIEADTRLDPTAVV